MIDQTRLDRYKELAKAKNLSYPEREERDALAKEFPETAAGFEAPKDEHVSPKASTTTGQSGVVSSANPTGRRR